MNGAGKGAERSGGEVIPFEAAERERTAHQRKCQRHPIYHTKRGLIDTESIEQIERSDGSHRQTNRECQTRVLAGVHEREAEGHETKGHHRFHGCESRAPARQQW